MSRSLSCLILLGGSCAFVSPRAALKGVARRATVADEEVDVVVIGSGLAGMSCAALLASQGKKVQVLEAHYELGGCAHEWAVDMDGRTVPSERLKDEAVFRFEAGPSLYSGLSSDKSANPLKHVFQMVGEEPEWITYDTWGAFLPEAPEGYELSIGASNFAEILRRYGGPTANSDWEKLSATLRPLAKGVMGLPSVAVRGDVGIIATLGLRYPAAFLRVLGDASTILKPFDMESKDSPFYVQDDFLRNYLDLIAFLLQGLPANQTLTAVMAYMVEDFYREGAVMDYPRGGSRALIEALQRGLEKHGGSVQRSAAVSRVLVENGRAVGVVLKGRTIRAKHVVSNADLHATMGFVEEGQHVAFDEERKKLLSTVPLCKSFMHVHLGIKMTAEEAAGMPPQWTICGSWEGGIDAPANVIVVSMPSKLDKDMAPSGHHTIHAYTAGNEPYELWEPYEDRQDDPAYHELKIARSKPIFDAIMRHIPDLRERIVVEQIGTPLTHKRFLRRHRGNYGPAIAAGNDLGIEFPAVTTPLPGYYRCGDSTTAGIGVPAVASSGAQCANAILSTWEQLKMNSKIVM